MPYTFLKDVSANDEARRIILEQIDMVMSGLEQWDVSIDKITYASAHIEKILVLYELIAQHGGTEFSDRMSELEKIQQDYTGICQPTIHLKAFKYMQKAHPDWFSIHPCDMAKQTLKEECKVASLDSEFIDELVHNTKAVLTNARKILNVKDFQNIDLPNLIETHRLERQSLAQIYRSLRTEPSDNHIAELNDAIRRARLKNLLFRKLDHKFSKLQKRTLKPLSGHLSMHTQLTSLREDFLEHPELYGSYSQILQLLGLIDRTKKELYAQIKPLGKMTFTKLKHNQSIDQPGAA